MDATGLKKLDITLKYQRKVVSLYIFLNWIKSEKWVSCQITSSRIHYSSVINLDTSSTSERFGKKKVHICHDATYSYSCPSGFHRLVRGTYSWKYNAKRMHNERRGREFVYFL